MDDAGSVEPGVAHLSQQLLSIRALSSPDCNRGGQAPLSFPRAKPPAQPRPTDEKRHPIETRLSVRVIVYEGDNGAAMQSNHIRDDFGVPGAPPDDHLRMPTHGGKTYRGSHVRRLSVPDELTACD